MLRWLRTIVVAWADQAWADIRWVLMALWRRLIGAHRRRLTIRVHHDQVETVAPALNTAVMRTWLRRGCHITVVLGPDTGALVRTVGFPAAAERHLSHIVHHQVPRLTPFPAGTAAVDYRIVTRDGQDDRMTVQLAAVPIAALKQTFKTLERVGLVPDVVTVSGPDGPVPLNWLEADACPPPPRHAWPLARLTALPFARAVLVTVAVFIGLNMAGKAAAYAWLGRESPAIEAEAREAIRLRTTIDSLGGANRFITSRQAKVPPKTALVDALSATLPDGTWLTDLSIDAGTVDIQGQTTDAAALLPLLDAHPLFTDPQFTGAVRRLGAGGERFQIRARMAGVGPQEGTIP